MPHAGFLAQLGMFVLPRFLDSDECARLRAEMEASPSDPARILTAEYQPSIDRGTRRTDITLISSATRTWITSRLMTLKPALEKHFNVQLHSCESPSFLVYKEGFYYSRHVDANHSHDAPAQFQGRRVSISAFLNGEGEEHDRGSYSGGSLTFHAQQKNDTAARPGLALTGEEGLLIGFDSDWPHEITPVQRGTRYSIVTWFA